ncbi:NfeD family protein [Candidatus Microgenomates bacterium]|nr:NfeD family protein [Candidatus Microgenomates bacterium]
MVTEYLAWILVFVGLGAIVLELILGVTTGFDFALLGSCLLVGGILGFVTNNFYFAIGTSAILAVLYIFIGRKFVKAKLTIFPSKTNIDSVLGKKGKVTKEITANSAGQVKIGTETWRALPVDRLDKIGENEMIEVVDVDGVTLIVKT